MGKKKKRQKQQHSGGRADEQQYTVAAGLMNNNTQWRQGWWTATHSGGRADEQQHSGGRADEQQHTVAAGLMNSNTPWQQGWWTTTHSGGRADEQRQLANVFAVRIVSCSCLTGFHLISFCLIGFVTHLPLSGFFYVFPQNRKKKRGRKRTKRTEQFSSVQLKVVSVCSEKPICAPPHLLEVSPTSPLKWFQRPSDWQEGPLTSFQGRLPSAASWVNRAEKDGGGGS